MKFEVGVRVKISMYVDADTPEEAIEKAETAIDDSLEIPEDDNEEMVKNNCWEAERMWIQGKVDMLPEEYVPTDEERRRFLN
ncbi:MAG: hypothetical protein JXK93_09295 [Sphaerochaetaceae bacterium]|nr:hypothetical protein [Sphaerochaetaceae bacterium]